MIRPQIRTYIILSLRCIIILLGVSILSTSTLPIRVRLPAEYAPVQTVALSWPGPYPDLWPMYRSFVSQLRAAADVQILVPDAATQRIVHDYLGDAEDGAGTLSFLRIPTHSIWIRDYGPLFVRMPPGAADLTAIDLRYEPISRDPLAIDDPIPGSVAREMGLRLRRLPLTMEGGNILSDGYGTCFTSESTRYRNSDQGERGVRVLLRQQLGCERTVFLPVLAGEPTGHIGLYLKLVDPHTALVAQCSTERDPNCARLDTIAQVIGQTTAPGGGRYRIVRVPYPWLSDTPNGREYASYVNGVIVNQYAFVPQFGLAEDAAALQAYREAAPLLRVVGVDVTPLVRLGGALQCITLPIPARPMPGNQG